MKKIASYILLTIVLSFTVLTFTSQLFGYRYYVVVSDSMYPAIPKYSLVYVKLNEENKKTNLVKDQIIAFNTGGIPVMHRIISINNDEIITHGDNNRVGVNETVDYDDVIGIVSFSIPIIGLLFINKFIIPIIILLIITFIILKEIIKELRNRR